MVNEERLTNLFCDFVRIDSVSRNEKAVSEKIQEMLKEFDAEVLIDDSTEKTGSNTGNLVVKIKGNVDAPPMILSGHMDTVEPGEGIIPVLKDGVFSSEGETILGSDDKSALAIIFEILTVLKENDLKHGPLELVITVCEEIGLIGAKHLDYSLIDSRFGYVLDSTDTEGVVTRAPYAYRFEFKVHGKASHAGAAPENGINAITVAATAVAQIKTGRLDSETTCNIGKIEGGIATNIVPPLAVVTGEARGHDKAKLDKVMDSIIFAFEKAVNDGREDGSALPMLEVSLDTDFPGTNIPNDHDVVTFAKQAAANLGIEMKTKTIGGGSDANIFFEKGIVAGVIGTGMTDVHTVNETIKLSDMVRNASLILEIIKLHAENGPAIKK